MTFLQPFNPQYGSNKTVSASSSSARVAINKESRNVCITNTGSNIAYIRIGDSSVTATAADFPVMPGNQVIITKGIAFDYIAYISASGTTLGVMTGEGW